jgi:hypothetical protein
LLKDGQRLLALDCLATAGHITNLPLAVGVLALLVVVCTVQFPMSCVGLIAVAGIAYRRRDNAALILAVSALAFIRGDTLLCNAISGVHVRYRARVTWLAPMTVLLYLFRPRANDAAIKTPTSPAPGERRRGP